MLSKKVQIVALLLKRRSMPITSNSISDAMDREYSHLLEIFREMNDMPH
jgi:hypothetical protein